MVNREALPLKSLASLATHRLEWSPTRIEMDTWQRLSMRARTSSEKLNRTPPSGLTCLQRDSEIRIEFKKYGLLKSKEIAKHDAFIPDDRGG